VFLYADRPDALAPRLSEIAGAMKPDASVWVLWPKGKDSDAGYALIKAAADPLGLVDTKYVAFSKALGALKLVLRKERRPRGR
jgi:hypothetical protein